MKLTGFRFKPVFQINLPVFNRFSDALAKQLRSPVFCPKNLCKSAKKDKKNENSTMQMTYIPQISWFKVPILITFNLVQRQKMISLEKILPVWYFRAEKLPISWKMTKSYVLSIKSVNRFFKIINQLSILLNNWLI